MGRVIVTVSGGKASAWCADWALKNYQKEDVLLYFNDTKWEHPDLYRFLSDLERYLNHKILWDSDGRSPEALFYDNRALANNRMPFCSRVLKAERLHKFYQGGDTLVFGIGQDELHRARRVADVYRGVAERTNKWPIVRFPLIAEEITKEQVDSWLRSTGIEEPTLYKLGFLHNNCSGGCVRAGKKHWKLLYEKLPEVYLDRERVENDIRAFLGKDISFFKDETLGEFRKRIEDGKLSSYYDTDDTKEEECIGICHILS